MRRQVSNHVNFDVKLEHSSLLDHIISTIYLSDLSVKHARNKFNVKNINDLKIKNWRLSAFTTENVYNVLNSTKKKKQKKKDDEQQRQRIRSWYKESEFAKWERWINRCKKRYKFENEFWFVKREKRRDVMIKFRTCNIKLKAWIDENTMIFSFLNISNQELCILIQKFRQISKTYLINKIPSIVQKPHLESCFITRSVL